ncbi:hypothetical protein N7516_000669 [Penicillium verrucosum]|uniref:uncharacterized protein n=1 Tax=Penicillium verrucosum TaxID=60171 RepID=UPI002545B7EB|nr:uncharacterized protein N7516_000669 [Penicillium verrucosum]KAJ5940501.1 hypothetical protein N7516_000669 [Penicillium verrucosum]
MSELLLESELSWVRPAHVGLFLVFSVSIYLAVSLVQRSHPAKLDLPIFEVQNEVVKTIEEAHKKYPDSPFVLSLVGMEMVILPRSSIDLIKSLPETHVSIKKHHHDVFLGEYTYMGTKTEEFDAAMRHDLTRNTPTVLASFNAEVQHAIDENVGSCWNWTPLKPRAAMCRVASLMSGRAFVGVPLSHDEEWVEATVNYTGNVTQAWLHLRTLNRFVRPFVAPFLPQVKALMRMREMTSRKMAPLLEEIARGDDKGESSDTAGGDMIRWFQARYDTKPSARELARDQLLATFASIYNLSNALTYLIFDLASYPECIEPLRRELDEVLGDQKTIDKDHLQRLKKLDSFVRESQRHSPPSLANMPRVVTHPDGLRLPTGQYLPQGTRIMVRAHTLNMDPELYPDPTRFDAFRFSRLREAPGSEFKYQHVTTGTDNINFGHGVWACPGRFFASSQMKVVVAHILRNYDIKLPEGQPRPKQQHYGLAILSDATAEVVLKSRV